MVVFTQPLVVGFASVFCRIANWKQLVTHLSRIDNNSHHLIALFASTVLVSSCCSIEAHTLRGAG
jgi:hypothetical protein